MAGIYIHIPYCHAKCAYCDFYSLPRRDEAPALLQAMRGELAARLPELGGEPVRTLYMGGGTPSIIAPQAYAALVGDINTEALDEFTFEANPEDVDADMAQGWRSLGANRASIGVQSLNAETLREIGRRHSPDDALRAIDTLQRAGITNISGDLIYGLPGQTTGQFRADLQRLISTGVTHLSAYCLQWEPGTRLYARLQAGKTAQTDEDTLAEMYAALCETAAANGFEHYEISNFALPGKHSRHNSAYWNLTPYLGLGPSAHSFDGRSRRVNPASIKQYLATAPTAFDIEEESDADIAADLIFTGLRTAAGLDTSRLPDPIRAHVDAEAKRFVGKGLLTLHGDTLAIPEEHFLIADSIIRDLLP